MKNWDEIYKIILKFNAIVSIEKNMMEIYETHRNLPDWESSVSRLIVRDEQPPETDERVYLALGTKWLSHDLRYGSTMVEHLHRYRLARLFAVGLDVLDLCCGCGYGTALLSDVAKKVTGVDYNKGAIGWANRHYPWVDCRVMDATRLTFPDESFDLVVSMEGIEHVYDNDAYLYQVRRVLKDGGGFLFSTPSSPQLVHTPHGDHKWCFTSEFLQEQLSKYFTEVHLFSQRNEQFIALTFPCYYMGLCWNGS